MRDLVNNDDKQIWYRVLGMLQQEWAVVNKSESQIYFFNDSGMQIDQIVGLNTETTPQVFNALGFQYLDPKDQSKLRLRTPSFNEDYKVNDHGKYSLRYKSLNNNNSYIPSPRVNEISGKDFKVTYERGHFYTEEGQKIVFEPNGEYMITSSGGKFFDKDPLLHQYEPKNSLEKSKSIMAAYRGKKPQKVLSAGTPFRFKAELANTDKHDKIKQVYSFNGVLMEDLYLYQNLSGNWRCANCICKLTECSDNELNLREEIYANSLNKLFATTITYYFGLKRSTAINVFKSFTFVVQHPLDIEFLDPKEYRLEYFRDFFNEYYTLIKDSSKHD